VVFCDLQKEYYGCILYCRLLCRNFLLWGHLRCFRLKCQNHIYKCGLSQ
jgi:hypothetical protein